MQLKLAELLVAKYSSTACIRTLFKNLTGHFFLCVELSSSETELSFCFSAAWRQFFIVAIIALIDRSLLDASNIGSEKNCYIDRGYRGNEKFQLVTFFIFLNCWKSFETHALVIQRKQFLGCDCRTMNVKKSVFVPWLLFLSIP